VDAGTCLIAATHDERFVRDVAGRVVTPDDGGSRRRAGLDARRPRPRRDGRDVIALAVPDQRLRQRWARPPAKLLAIVVVWPALEFTTRSAAGAHHPDRACAPALLDGSQPAR
jgi:hypothetical protein